MMEEIDYGHLGQLAPLHRLHLSDLLQCVLGINGHDGVHGGGSNGEGEDGHLGQLAPLHRLHLLDLLRCALGYIGHGGQRTGEGETKYWL